MKDRDGKGSGSTKAMTARFKNKNLKCYYCGKLGHIKRNCRTLATEEKRAKSNHNKKKKA